MTHSIKTNVRVSDERLVLSDRYYSALFFELEIPHEDHNKDLISEGYYRDFNSVNVEIRDYLGQLAWDNLYYNQPLDTMIAILYDIFYFSYGIICTVKNFLAESFLGDSNLKENIVHRHFKTSGLHSDYTEFSNLRTECKRLTISISETTHCKQTCGNSGVSKTQNENKKVFLPNWIIITLKLQQGLKLRIYLLKTSTLCIPQPRAVPQELRFPSIIKT